ncbi:hypothetical protein DPMN_101290 [Dreissena polymorpha]|uniref:Uncharacterized protein n=1 Tax=Dreissena polymorpha TaxID=45954 RepID=A0A9D4LHB7_DREPO|nr:hypothetical protein DPMN_101290 [Dreissena polymorpha]
MCTRGVNFSKCQLDKHLANCSKHYPQRSYATNQIPKKFQRKFLPFEQTSSGTAEKVIFSCQKWKFRAFLVSCSGVFLCGTILNSTELIYNVLKSKSKAVANERGEYPWYYWWTYINVDLGSFPVRIALAALLTGCAVFVLAMSMMYPSRVVRELTLLKGHEKLLIETYGPFGIPRTIEIPLKDLSAVWGAKSIAQEKTMPLKVRGKRFFFQVLTEKGQIHDKELFDHAIAVQRFEVERLSWRK